MHSTAQHSTAQHSTLGQLSKRLVQVTAFTLSCLVVLPSFTQTASADSCFAYGCYNDDGVFDFYPNPSNPPYDDDDWRNWYGDWISDPGGRDTDPYEEPPEDYDPPEECSDGNSSGGNKNGDDCAEVLKERYCDQKSAVIALMLELGNATIELGSGQLTIIGVSAGYSENSIYAGVSDIDYFFDVDNNYQHPNRVFRESSAINWQRANIDWRRFDDSWSALNSGIPTIGNSGARHVLAQFFMSANLSDLESLVPPDPNPSQPCLP